MNSGRLTYHYFAGALLLCLSLHTQPATAGFCADLLSKTKSYFQEVRQTKGVRLLVRPAIEPEPFYGFVTRDTREIPGWRAWPTLHPLRMSAGEWMYGEPGWRFAPFNGLQTVLIDKPTDWIVHQFAGTHKDASLIAKLPAIVGWALLAHFYVIEPVTDYAMDKRIESQIQLNRNIFAELIQTDYRFDHLRQGLRDKTMSAEEAARQAYMISRAYASYYKFRDGKEAKFTYEENLELLNHYLFGHLRPVMSGVVKVPPGFTTNEKFRSELTQAQKENLFRLTHGLYIQYQLVDLYSKGGDTKGLTKDLENSPFVKNLNELLADGKVNKSAYTRILQEQVYWAYRLKAYDVMGLIKLNPSSGQPVTIVDIENEILNEALSGK